MNRLISRLSLVATIAVLLAACSGGTPLQDIAKTRGVPAGQDGPVVVFLPGTLASKLVDTATGDVVWGRADALSVDPREPDGLRQLSLPLDPVPSSVAGAEDSIRATDVLRRANERVIGIPVSLGIYDDLLIGLSKAGLPETEPLMIPSRGPSLTTFPYDWRRSIVDAAQELGRTLEARGEGAAKVRIVGHSMGGVVALWYLMHGTAPLDANGAPPPITWAGAQHVDHAVLVGAPLRGAAIAVRNTVNGNELAGPLVPTFPPAMLASHPSSFELMPREGAGTLVDKDGSPLGIPLLSADTWRRKGWGLTDPSESRNVEILAPGDADPTRLADARQMALIARGAAFHRAADRQIEPPEGLRLTAIAGTGMATPKTVVFVKGSQGVKVAGYGDGDGTVLLSSVLAGFEDASQHPRKDVHIVEAEHMRILSQPAVFTKVLDTILRD